MDQLKVHLVRDALGYAGLEFRVNERPLVDWINFERSSPLRSSAYSLVNVDWLLRETGPWKIGDDLPGQSWRYEDEDDKDVPGGQIEVYSRESLYPALFICSCGMERCWSIQCRVEMTPDKVLWTDFRESSGHGLQKYTIHFEFDLPAYRAEFERIQAEDAC